MFLRIYRPFGVDGKERRGPARATPSPTERGQRRARATEGPDVVPTTHSNHPLLDHRQLDVENRDDEIVENVRDRTLDRRLVGLDMDRRDLLRSEIAADTTARSSDGPSPPLTATSPARTDDRSLSPLADRARTIAGTTNPAHHALLTRKGRSSDARAQPVKDTARIPKRIVGPRPGGLTAVSPWIVPPMPQVV